MTRTRALAPDGSPVNALKIEHGGLQLELMDWGASWLSCLVPMPDRSRREILLGCKSLEDWFTQKAFLNATVGRYANRIANARISHAGTQIQLSANQEDKHQLHGGAGGFSQRRWTILEKSTEHVRFGIHSPDGDQGFPGNLSLQVVYRILPGLRILMECSGETDAPCPVGLTQHAYFNLDGTQGDIRAHGLRIAASRYAPIDAEMIPSGVLADVAHTSFDFRSGKTVGADFLADTQQKLAAGYDHAFLLDAPDMQTTAAELESGDAKLCMRLYTDSPTLQFYSGNHLAGTASRDGRVYAAREGLCLEPGFLPDSPNHPEWPQPSCWLTPGQQYHQTACWEFLPRP